MFLLRCSLFWACCLLDILNELILGLVFIYWSRWVVNLLVDIEAVVSSSLRTTTEPNAWSQRMPMSARIITYIVTPELVLYDGI